MTTHRNNNRGFMLLSTYRGMPCPGGVYYHHTRTFVKKLKHSSYFWPKRAFPVDGPVLDRLKELGCRVLILQIAETGQRYRISMEEFLANATCIDWTKTDGRFPKRWYCPIEKWTELSGEREAV